MHSIKSIVPNDAGSLRYWICNVSSSNCDLVSIDLYDPNCSNYRAFKEDKQCQKSFELSSERYIIGDDESEFVFVKIGLATRYQTHYSKED